VQSVKSYAVIDTAPEKAFDIVFMSDHLSVFNNIGYVGAFFYVLPNIHFFRPGYQHRIYFEDGGNAVRKLNTYLPGISFSAMIYDFSSWRYRGLSCIDYFYFVSEDLEKKGYGIIEFEYRFQFRSTVWAFMFYIFGRRIVQKRMDTVLSIIVQDVSAACL